MGSARYLPRRPFHSRFLPLDHFLLSPFS
uniref:Uncharacterized protein n=1 Tax=Anguilla anguilla TaxID=7936 RepID=A0A0E9TZQ7_ANGAN